MLTKSERASNIPEKKLLGKTKTLMHFDSKVNRDGMKEGKSLRQLFTSNVSTD